MCLCYTRWPRSVMRGKGTGPAARLCRLCLLIAQPDGVTGTHFDQLLILIANLRGPHNVRSDCEDDFILTMILGLLAEQILQNRNFCEPRIAAQRLCFGIL